MINCSSRFHIRWRCPTLVQYTLYRTSRQKHANLSVPNNTSLLLTSYISSFLFYCYLGLYQNVLIQLATAMQAYNLQYIAVHVLVQLATAIYAYTLYCYSCASVASYSQILLSRPSTLLCYSCAIVSLATDIQAYTRVVPYMLFMCQYSQLLLSRLIPYTAIHVLVQLVAHHFCGWWAGILARRMSHGCFGIYLRFTCAIKLNKYNFVEICQDETEKYNKFLKGIVSQETSY